MVISIIRGGLICLWLGKMYKVGSGLVPNYTQRQNPPITDPEVLISYSFCERYLAYIFTCNLSSIKFIRNLT